MTIRNCFLCAKLLCFAFCGGVFCLLIIPDGPARFDLISHHRNATLTNFNVHWIDRRLPVKFLVHGYRQNLSFPNYQAVVVNYLKRGKYNVITVDYTNIAYLTYAECFFKLPQLELYVAKFISFINKWYGIPLSSVHLIGHSLGGQIVGRTGNIFAELSDGKKLHRITSLDPTKMGFDSILTPPQLKTTGDSGTIVDVLHTNSQTIGVLAPTGTIDFYANRGFAPQPGCVTGPTEPLIDNIPLSDGWIIPLDSDNTCSHEFSIVLFAQSIVMKGSVRGRRCMTEKWDVLNGTCHDTSGFNTALVDYGEDLPSGLSGIYYFFTNDAPPFMTIDT